MTTPSTRSFAASRSTQSTTSAATTKALAKKYLRHKDEKVAGRAKEIVEKLEDK